MTWEIIAGGIAIITCGIAIGKVIYELSKTLTKLNCSVDALNITLKNFKSENATEHKQFRSDIKNHEERIHELEVHNK